MMRSQQRWREFELGADDQHRVEQPAELSGTGVTTGRHVGHPADPTRRPRGRCRSEPAKIVRADASACFLLDDHEIVRRGVRDLLEAEDDIEVVGEAGTAEEAVGRIPATSPDVAVLDVRLA